MKRFLVIFAICFASIIGIMGGIFGVKFLKGDFNEVVVNPEKIAFELDEYDVTGDFKVTITTQTEDVTATKVTLSFVKGTNSSGNGVNTYGKDYLTDGVIIIPKEVKLNVPFDVRLFKTNDTETDNLEWIKGGISNIEAKSECTTTPIARTKICVDVPVYKTEIVLFDGNGTVSKNSDYKNVLSYIEGQTGLAKKVKADDENISFNAGDTFYLGLKFYPERSAYKYSKVSSTNLLVEYYDEILAKMEELNLDYSAKLETLKNLLQTDKNTKEVDFQEIIKTYSQIINLNSSTSENVEFANYLSTLNTNLLNNLKYYAFEEKVLNNKSYINKVGKVDGTNLYELEALQDSTSFSSSELVELYSYSFSNSAIEDDTLKAASDYTNLLDSLEKMYTQQGQELKNKKVDKQTKQFNIVDVDVSNIEVAGSIEDFSTNKIHTIYASKNGTNTENISYLNINLSNSNVSSVNLQDKILNVGIRFEKRLSSNSWGVADEIKLVDQSNYTKVRVLNDDETTYSEYYLPIGSKSNYNNAYWQIYSDDYIANDFRAVLIYIKSYNENSEGKLEAIKDNTLAIVDNPLFRLLSADSDEQLIKWTSLNDLTLGVVNISGVVDMSAENVQDGEVEVVKDVSYNKEVDLSKLVNIPQSNYFQTTKFFIYSDEEVADKKLSTYFATVDSISKPYTLKGLGITKNLYELDGSILKLKGQEVPSYSVNVIFATIRTSALLNPIMVQSGDYEIYDIVKYSAVKDSLVENLSYLSVNFTNAINTLNAQITNIDSDKAGIANNDGLFKIAQNSKDVITLKISGGTGDEDKIKNAISNGDIKLEARESKNNATNYISFTTTQEADGIYMSLSSAVVTHDVKVRLYLVYTVDGNEYLFSVAVRHNSLGNKDYYTTTIVNNTSSNITFDIKQKDGSTILTESIDYILVSTTYNATTNKYEKKYRVIYKDDTITEQPEITLFAEDSRVRVLIIDFLGNIDETTTTGWFLQSSNANILSVQNNQYINFVGTSENLTTLSLYVGTSENNVLSESINFKVENSGYVDEVIKYYGEANQRTEFKYNEENPTIYKFPTQNMSLEKLEGDDVVLSNLLVINYKLGENTQPLTMEIYIANLASLNVLKQISNIAITEENYKTTPISSFTLTKNLGTVVNIDLTYICKDLDITQAVSLKLSQVYSINKVDVKNISNNSVSKTDSTYNIYKGIPYTVEITTDNVSNTKELYYYFDGDSTKTPFKVVDNKYTIEVKFKDSSSAKRQLYITSTNSDDENAKIGELVYCIDFNAQDNLVIAVKNSTLGLTGNKVKIALTDLLARKEISGATLSQYPLLFTNLTFDYREDYADDNAKLYIGGPTEDSSVTDNENRYIELEFSEFTDEANVKFYIVLDEVIIGLVSLKIIPENLVESENYFALYKGNRAIVVSNGEVISNNNDETNIFASLFKDEDGIDVSYDYAVFNGTYTTKSGTVRKVTLSNNNLFTNTDTFVTVKKDGISTKYLIVISRLKFPFVTLLDNSGNALNYSNLDINKLFEDTENLYSYYTEKGIKFFTATLNEETNTQEIVLMKNGENKIYNSNSNQNIFNMTDCGMLEMVIGDSLSSSYATLQIQDETVKVVAKSIGVDGGVYLKVSLKLAQSGTTTYFYIPTIIHLEQNQKLVVNYPNSGVSVEKNEDGYGSADYDNVMFGTNLPFALNKVEYLSFNAVQGTAELSLTNNKYTRFVVKEKDTSSDFTPIVYTGELKYSIEKIVKNVGGVWSEVQKTDFIDYATITVSSSDAVLNVSKYMGLDIVRLKIKVTTEGGAENYVYVFVGENEQLTLMRKTATGSPISIGSVDNVTLKSLDTILIGTGAYSLTANDTYYYYLTNINYNSELKFRLVSNGQLIGIDNASNIFIQVDSNKITLNVQPTGANFAIELYTIYGVLSTLNITVEPAYVFTAREVNLYSGTSYQLADLVVMTTNIEPLQSSSITNIQNTNSNIYFTCDGTEITFAHLQSQVAFNLVLTVTISSGDDEYIFDITLKNVLVLPRIESNYPNQVNPFVDMSEEDCLTTKIVDTGKISISKDIWSSLFKDVKLNANFNAGEFTGDSELCYLVDSNLVNKNADIEYNIGAISSIVTRKIQFTIAVENGENYTEIATAYAMFTIKPQYTIIINYPIIENEEGQETTFNCEYIQNGASIDFSAKTISGLDRLAVKNAISGALLSAGDYKIKLSNTEVSSYTFDFDNADFVNGEILQEFDIYISDIKYATYIVKVTKDSPISFVQNTSTVYVSYNKTDANNDNADVFNYVDVIVTMPEIKDAPNKVSVYVANQAGVTTCEYIAKDIFYRQGEKIRCTLKISKYEKGVSKVFVATDTSVSLTDTEANAEFSVRGTLKYYNQNVRFEDYGNIIGAFNLMDVDMEGKNSKEVVKPLTKKTSCSIVKDANIASSCTINLVYDIVFEEDLLNGERTISLNANEVEEGYSFIELFGLKDSLGNTFWLNNIKTEEGMTLKIKDLISSINCMPITPVLKESIRYDYNLKPLGASNDGTTVTLEFTYNLGENRIYKASFNVFVISDIEFELCNESLASTNTSSNPLKISYAAGSKVLLASETLTSYIYAYSKYSTNKPNLVQRWTDLQISGDKSYITVINEDGGIYLSVLKESGFGNKNITITFTDPYNFTFNYYIETIADTEIISYSADNKKVYEGDYISVYNKNHTTASGSSSIETGIGVIMKNGENIDVSTNLIIDNIFFVKNGKTQSNMVQIIKEEGKNTNQIQFNFLSFDNIWNNDSVSNGLSFVGTLYIDIKNSEESSAEVYTLIVPFTIYKKYRTDIATENTYVRENVPIDIEHYVDVYDYSQDAYLGKPELTKGEALVYNFDIKDIEVDYKDSKTALSEVLKSNCNEWRTVTGTEAEKQEKKLEIIDSLKDYGIITRTDDISYSEEGGYELFSITLKVVAKNKVTNITISDDIQFDIATNGKVCALVELGDENTKFAGINSLNYSFEYWLYDINNAKTINTKPINTSEVDVKDLYHMEIVNSKNVSDNIRVQLSVLYKDGRTEVESIEEYTISKSETTTTPIIGGKHSFYLYGYLDKEIKSISLFTGKNGGVEYVNGLSLEDACNSKNIKYDSTNHSKITPIISKTVTALSVDSTYNVPYALSSTGNMTIKFSEFAEADKSKQYAYEEKAYNLLVTPKYTGVDTSLAYSTSIHYCYDINFEGKLDDNGAISDDGGITVDLSVWSEGFKLKTGVGISAILAQSENKDFFGSNGEDGANINSLYFEEGNVYSSATMTTTDKNELIFTVDSATGVINLKKGYIPNDYYISIKVYCKYGEPLEGGEYRKVELATLYVQFVNVENINVVYDSIEESTGMPNYRFALPSLVFEAIKDKEITKENVSLGVIPIKDFVITEENATLYIKTDSAMENGKVYTLMVGSISKLVRLYFKPYAFDTIFEISVSKLDDKYVILTENIKINYLTQSLTLKEYLETYPIETEEPLTLTLTKPTDGIVREKTFIFTLNGSQFERAIVEEETSIIETGKYEIKLEGPINLTCEQINITLVA